MAFGWDDAAAIASPVLGLATGIGAGKRQIKQQKKLNELGIDAYRQQREIDQANQMEMWNATNVGAQIEHMKNAGMSISAMYGGSGGGGTTAGSGGGSVPIATADGETARQAMGLQLGRQAAELALLQAQTKKTEVETENIAGVDRENKKETTRGIKFNNDMNDYMQETFKEMLNDMKEITWEKILGVITVVVDATMKMKELQEGETNKNLT